MSLISFTPIQDGVTGVNAAATNTPLNTIYNDYNGNITDANISASAAIASSKVAITQATMSNPYKFSAYNSANLTVTASTWTKIQLNTKAFDTNSNYDNTTNYQFTAPINGFYLFVGKVGSGSLLDGQFIAAGINVGSFSSSPTYTGNNVAVGGATLGIATVTEFISLTAGQTVQLYGFTSQTNIQAGPGDTNLSGFLVSKT